MQQCPICKEWKASYYKCYTGALSKLIGAYPEIAETASEWLLLEEEEPVPPQYFNQQWTTFETSFLSGKYNDYQRVVSTQDLILIHMCRPCFEIAKARLLWAPYEVIPLERFQCPCCGFFTLEGAYESICQVCFWQFDGWELDEVSGPNHITLRQGRKNYREFGSCCAPYFDHARRPKPEEYPIYHQ